MKEKYDLIFSLGSFPLVASILRQKELQIYDFPFDKISGGDFLTRMSLLLLDCRDFIEQKNLVKEDNPSKSDVVQIKDIKTGFVYYSDFDKKLPIENIYPSIKQKIDKYIKTLNILLRAAKKVLILYVENPQLKEDDVDNEDLVKEAIEKLKYKYPQKEFKLIYVKNDGNIHNVKVSPIGNHSEKVILNFYKRFSEMSAYEIDVSVLSLILSNIDLNKTFKQKKMFYLQRLINFLSKFS